jgi:hypothetical protein
LVFSRSVVHTKTWYPGMGFELKSVSMAMFI